MTPIPFAEQNLRIKPPAGMTEEECSSLNAYQHVETGECGNPNCVEHATHSFTSCWQASPEEIEAFIKNGGRIYFTVYGWVHPMISVVPYPPNPQEDGPLSYCIQ